MAEEKYEFFCVLWSPYDGEERKDEGDEDKKLDEYAEPGDAAVWRDLGVGTWIGRAFADWLIG